MTPCTPLRRKNPPGYNIIKKSRFFETLDTKDPSDNVEKITKDHNIIWSTAYKRIVEKDRLGSPAYKKSQKFFSRLEYKPKISNI